MSGQFFYLCIDDQGIKNEFASGCYPSFPFLCCWTCIDIVFSFKSHHTFFFSSTLIYYQLYIHTIFSLFCTTREHHFSQSQSLNSKWHLCLSGPVPRYSWFCEDRPGDFSLKDFKGTSLVSRQAPGAGEALWPETGWTDLRQCCNRLSCRNSGTPWPEKGDAENSWYFPPVFVNS